MRLDCLTPAHFRHAVATYMAHAWPPGCEGSPRVDPRILDGCETLEDLLACCETPRGGDLGPTSARFTLRLGNHRYPFMKFVVQEYLVHGEYFFSVDTHDGLKITPDMPDYSGWCELRRFNTDLKEQIEDAWRGGDLPTHEDLRTLMEDMAQVECGQEGGARLLVVDDERDVARGLAAVLAARGYQVETAFDGQQVLDRMSRDPLPDLLVLDYSMPELNGEEVIERLRAQEGLADLPILLATATDIDLAAMARASGLLRKPYPAEVLFKMIRELLAASEGNGAGRELDNPS